MNKITVIGLPITGKTTFIAALWHILDSEEIDSELILDKYEGDNTYLNTIRAQWLGFDAVIRSKFHNTNQNPMIVRNKLTQKTFEILIPDLSGEIFDQQWENRMWTEEYKKLIDDSDKFLLFINPNNYQGSDEIQDLSQYVEIDQSVGPGEEKLEKIWNAKDTATQVKLVDLLQMILDKKQSKIMVEVIISAWDSVKEDSKTPEQFLAEVFPFLEQFLKANSNLISSCVIGVSAQGGDYKEEMEALSKVRPAERIKIVTKDGITNDISKCISWFD